MGVLSRINMGFMREHMPWGKRAKAEARTVKWERPKVSEKAYFLASQLTKQAKLLGAQEEVKDYSITMAECLEFCNGTALKISSVAWFDEDDVHAWAARLDKEGQCLESCELTSRGPNIGSFCYEKGDRSWSNNQIALDGINGMLKKLKTAKPLESQVPVV